MAEKKQTTLGSFFSNPKVSENTAKRKGNPSSSQEEWEKSKRKREFLAHWPEEFQGLLNSEKGMLCETCVKYASKNSSSFTTGCKTYRLQSIRSHWVSEVHIKACETKKCKVNENKGPLDKIALKLGEKHKVVLIHLFNTIYHINKAERPFSDLPGLLKLQVKNGSDLGLLKSYESAKACSRITKTIHEDLLEPFLQEIKEASVFSIFFDGATDCTVTEQEIIYGRYLKFGKPHDVF